MPLSRTSRALVPAMGSKVIDVIRHAEALHNPLVAAGKKSGDEALLRQGRSFLNPPLSETGRKPSLRAAG